MHMKTHFSTISFISTCKIIILWKGITRHDNLGDIANTRAFYMYSLLLRTLNIFVEIFMLIIETVKSRMSIDRLGEHLWGEGEDWKWHWTYEIMNCLKYNFAMHTFFDIEKINVYLIRGTFGGRRWKHGFERKKS